MVAYTNLLDQQKNTEIPTKNKCDHVIVFVTLRRVAFENCVILNMNFYSITHLRFCLYFVGG